MILRVNILAGLLQEPDILETAIRSRKDGAYRIELKRDAPFHAAERAKLHVWCRQIAEHTGTPEVEVVIEALKRSGCEALGWGRYLSLPSVSPEGELEQRMEFIRRSTEKMDAETYRRLMEHVRRIGEFLGLRLE